MPNTKPSSLEDLQIAWKHIFQNTLPDAACAKSSAQPIWPVHVDHCFARIILDNIVGIDTPWMAKLKSPAWKNLTEEQLKKCIEMGEGIMNGDEDLVELDANSLRLRGKKQKLEGGGRVDVDRKGAGDTTKIDEGEVKLPKQDKKTGKKKPTKQEDGKVSKYFTPQNPDKQQHSDDDMDTDSETQDTQSNEPIKSPHRHDKSTKQDMTLPLLRIHKSNKTPFQKQVLTLLCQIPPGQYSTYGLLSTHLSSSPRAVGNALRNNPFAPEVPCHRILATGGGLGGFGGSWGKKGEAGVNDEKKRKLLREEGVKFDGKGKVVGRPWSGFT